MSDASINQGAVNMLANCAMVRRGHTVVLAVEDPAFGFYNADLAPCVATAARHLGASVKIVQTGFDPEARAIPKTLLARFENADVVVFLSRLCDQLRFDSLPNGLRSVQCYALDATSLGASYGTIPYAALLALRDAADQRFSDASEIRITCAKGTSVSGRLPEGRSPSDTTCSRFPLSVFSPVIAAGFSGRVALPMFLTGTGARYYDPFTVQLPDKMFAHFENGRLSGFSGPVEGCVIAQEHYDFVSQRYDLDRDAIHSWHAGIHPGCKFVGDISRSYEAWSGSAFGNPRLLHFHTCGASPPGEISWNVVDPTIEVDGVRLWDSGVFKPELLQGGSKVLQDCPEFAKVFAAPEKEIGL